MKRGEETGVLTGETLEDMLFKLEIKYKRIHNKKCNILNERDNKSIVKLFDNQLCSVIISLFQVPFIYHFNLSVCELRNEVGVEAVC